MGKPATTKKAGEHLYLQSYNSTGEQSFLQQDNQKKDQLTSSYRKNSWRTSSEWRELDENKQINGKRRQNMGSKRKRKYIPYRAGDADEREEMKKERIRMGRGEGAGAGAGAGDHMWMRCRKVNRRRLGFRSPIGV